MSIILCLSKHGCTNLMTIEMECHCGFLKLVSLTVFKAQFDNMLGRVSLKPGTSLEHP